MYLSKEDFVLQAASGHSVLHLGCVGFTDLVYDDRIRSAKQSLHWKLTQSCDTLGVDYSTAVVEQYQRLGIFNNILVGNVERLEELPTTRKFDVVVAGDIIEHLSNPGRMLDGIRRFCTQETRVIITTPNAFGVPSLVRYALGKFQEGAEHVMSFNNQNLVTLLRRHGYSVQEWHSCFQSNAARHHSMILFGLGRKVFESFPRFGGTLLAVAKLSQA